jgi:hypothetical protein
MIKRQRWLARFFGFSGCLASALTLGMVGPVFGQVQNLSDTTGTNIFNSVSPGFVGSLGETLDPEILAEAQRLASALDEAYLACQESIDGAAALPRRFSVRGPSNQACVTSECAAYDLLLRESQSFVADVEADTADGDRFNTDRVW